MKSKRQDRIGVIIDTLKSHSSTAITDPTHKAEAFNQYFETLFTSENLDTIPDKGTTPFPPIPEFQIIIQGVHRLLLNF